jgi:hypothetical protein
MKKLKLTIAFLSLISLSYGQGLLNNLMACYPLNCNAINSATTGAALDGTPIGVNCVTGHTGAPNTAMNFAGNPGSYIQLPNDYRIKPDTISFSAWVKFGSVAVDQYIVFAHNTCTSFHEGYALVGDNTGAGGFKLSLVKANGTCTSSAGQQVLTGATSMTAGVWYHVGFFLSNSQMKVYLNGVLDGSASTSIQFNYHPTDAVYLGGSNLTFNRPLKGDMDNVRFWNREVVASEFNVLYQMDPPCNHSGLVGLLNGLEGCYPFNCDSINYAPTAIFPPSLDGTPFNLDCDTGHTGTPATAWKYKGLTSSYMQLPNDPRLKPTDITFAAWVKLDAVNTAQYIAFTKNSCTYYFEGYALVAVDAGGGNYKFQLVKSNATCSPGGQLVVNGGTTFPTNACASTWIHVAFTMNSSGMELFVNGVSDGSNGTAQAIDYDANWNVFLGVSNANWYDWPLDGTIDNVRFYSRVLTPQEIGILYNRDPDCDTTWCADPTDPNCSRYNPRPENTTGIVKQSSISNQFLIYPNPSTGKIYVDNSSNSSFAIYDITGKAVNYIKTAINEKTSEITIASEGIYFVKIFDSKGNYSQTTKIVIMK